MSMTLIKQILTGKFKLYYKANTHKTKLSITFINRLLLINLHYFLHYYYSQSAIRLEHNVLNMCILK
jgi:hypothetical protein